MRSKTDASGKMPAGTTSMVISTGSGLVRSVKRGGDIDDYLRRTRDEDERHLGNDVREDVQTFLLTFCRGRLN